MKNSKIKRKKVIPKRAAHAKKSAEVSQKQAVSTSVVVPAKSESAHKTLSSDENRLLAEAIRRGEEARDSMETALVSFGRWLLVEVFGNDAQSALEGGEQVRVWQALLEAADGYRLRLDKRTLSVSLRIAAYDHSLNDDVWRLLDPGRKALLLPLAEPELLKKAARHVATMKLTLAATAQYVATLRKELGQPPTVRMTPQRAFRAVQKLGAPLNDVRWVKKLGEQLRELPRERREQALEELRATRDTLARLISELK